MTKKLTQEQIELILAAKTAIDQRARESDEIYNALVEELGLRDAREDARTDGELYIQTHINPINWLFDILFNMSDSTDAEVLEAVANLDGKVVEYAELLAG